MPDFITGVAGASARRLHDEHRARAAEHLGEQLDAIASARIRVLHDRRAPGPDGAHIDHLVVTPRGLWVVRSERFSGKRPELSVEGGIVHPRVESLLVGGRDRTELITEVIDQVEAVRAELPDVAVAGALCLVHADWPMLGGTIGVQGIEVLSPGRLLDRIRETADGFVEVAQLADEVMARFGEA